MAHEEAPERKASSPLVELSNAMVALHRRHFGRGPAAARAFVNEGLAICILTDVYTRVEQTLIEAGRLEHVRETRQLHHQTLEESYRGAAEAALGRTVIAAISAVNAEPDVAVEVFLLGEALNGVAGNGAGARAEPGPSQGPTR
jgi:uncharacterized protein YbcI